MYSNLYLMAWETSWGAGIIFTFNHTLWTLVKLISTQIRIMTGWWTSSATASITIYLPHIVIVLIVLYKYSTTTTTTTTTTYLMSPVFTSIRWHWLNNSISIRYCVIIAFSHSSQSAHFGKLISCKPSTDTKLIVSTCSAGTVQGILHSPPSDDSIV